MGHRSRWLYGALAALIVAGVIIISVAVTGPPAAPPTPPSVPVDSSIPTPSTPAPDAGPPSASSRDTPSAAPLDESVPQEVRIDTIGVRSRLVDLGVGENGEVETPQDPDLAGWFTGATTPGSPGVAVLAGHVTWNGRPTVFFRLGELQKGDEISIRRADGVQVTYAVERRSTFAKDEFPTDEVYRSAAGPELVLITCGGNYDSSAGHYDANVIVWAKMLEQDR